MTDNLNNTYYISRKFKFECAHKLNNLPNGHPCGCIHGHSYKVEMIIFSKKLNKYGFIIDFGDLKIFQQWLDLKFDHALIISESEEQTEFIMSQKNFRMPYNNTSAENMAHYFANKMYELINEKDNIYKIITNVWETENNYAGYILNID